MSPAGPARIVEALGIDSGRAKSRRSGAGCGFGARSTGEHSSTHPRASSPTAAAPEHGKAIGRDLGHFAMENNKN
eukprot:2627478-Prymnesium_polylepis.1